MLAVIDAKLTISPISMQKTVAVALVVLLSIFSFPQAGLGAGEPGRDELDAVGDAARSTLLEHHPDIAAKLDDFPGYAVIGMSTTKIPGVGTGLGYGVIVDNRTDKRSYIKVTQFEVGGGLGAQRFKAVILFKEPALLDRTIKGGWHFESSADLSSGADTVESGTTASLSKQSGKGYKVYKLAESGALATMTVRALFGKPYLVD